MCKSKVTKIHIQLGGVSFFPYTSQRFRFIQTEYFIVLYIFGNKMKTYVTGMYLKDLWEIYDTLYNVIGRYDLRASTSMFIQPVGRQLSLLYYSHTNT